MNELTPATAPAIWDDGEMLECVSVVPEMADTASFTFRAPSGALFSYDPGQFLTLEIPTPDQPAGVVHRTYTIRSAPSRPRSITITAKAQADSIGTRWMLDNLKPGMRLRTIGPAGLFTNAQSTSDKYLFLSAGSDINPMMSMTTCMCNEGRDLDSVFINCAKRPSEIIFRQRLEQMASCSPRARSEVCCRRTRSLSTMDWLSGPVQSADARPDGAGLSGAGGVLLRP